MSRLGRARPQRQILTRQAVTSAVGSTLTATGTPAIEEITASGSVTQVQKLIGTSSVDEILAAGVSTILKKTSGTPNIAEILSSGVVSQIQKLTGTPSIEEVIAAGVSGIVKTASGSSILGEIEAAGTSVQTLKPSGTPSIPVITASGVSTLGANVSTGTPSIDEIEAVGTVIQRQVLSGTPSIDTILAAGIATIIKRSTGTPSIEEISAAGVSGFAGLLSAAGTPSIEEIVAAGNVIQTYKASGALSVEEITASGISTIISAVKTASGTPAIEEVIASGTSSLNVTPPITPTIPGTNYSGKIALDLADPGDIIDPATDRAIRFIHDAIEQLSINVITNHNQLPDITPNQHHNQAHVLYGVDHSDIDISNAIVNGDGLVWNASARKFLPVNIFPAGHILYGDVDNFTPADVAGEILTNYASELVYGTGVIGDVDDVAGEITIPETGIYTIKVWLTGTQGSATIDQTFILQLNIDASQLILAVLDVSSAASTARAFNAVMTSSFLEGEVLSLSLGATANMGVFTTVGSSFEVVRVG